MTFGVRDQEVGYVKDSPARVRSARRTVQSMGGAAKAFQGILAAECDPMFLLEASSAEAVAEMAP